MRSGELDGGIGARRDDSLTHGHGQVLLRLVETESVPCVTVHIRPFGRTIVQIDVCFWAPAGTYQLPPLVTRPTTVHRHDERRSGSPLARGRARPAVSPAVYLPGSLLTVLASAQRPAH